MRLIRLAWHDVPGLLVPRDAIIASVGTVNREPLGPHAAGTLLLAAPTLSSVRGTDGSRLVNILYPFYRKILDGEPRPWNPPEIEPPPYAVTDFNQLFLPRPMSESGELRQVVERPE